MWRRDPETTKRDGLVSILGTTQRSSTVHILIVSMLLLSVLIASIPSLSAGLAQAQTDSIGLQAPPPPDHSYYSSHVGDTIDDGLRRCRAAGVGVIHAVQLYSSYHCWIPYVDSRATVAELWLR